MQIYLPGSITTLPAGRQVSSSVVSLTCAASILLGKIQHPDFNREFCNPTEQLQKVFDLFHLSLNASR